MRTTVAGIALCSLFAWAPGGAPIMPPAGTGAKRVPLRVALLAVSALLSTRSAVANDPRLEPPNPSHLIGIEDLVVRSVPHPAAG